MDSTRNMCRSGHLLTNFAYPLLLSDMAVSALVEALATSNKIVRLILAYNAIGQQSCMQLSDLLLKSRTLEYLDWYKAKADVL